ncbi:hypothetical protein T03_17224 [Trichinella britovi]|uniref:Uncharacterized protein n=1 Tax=Trichinella britovi TaxID=45882 RepID=A0A0V1AIG6_TRIBR|nr:hypothetical protein T03_17224 [Trichinella britovi]
MFSVWSDANDNETYQSASPAPPLFLHLEFCEIVISGCSKSIKIRVNILKRKVAMCMQLNCT